jgi:uncharacterized membrane protein
MRNYLQSIRILPLAFCSALACAALAGRVVVLDEPGGRFLVWNLTLAWAPYLLSLLAQAAMRGETRLRQIALPGALWLLFFPNGPYVVTDFIHLSRHSPDFDWWYVFGTIALFAWTGCFLALESLATMHRLVQRAAGALAGWLFVLASAGLCGLGIWIGRFLRWNSWDLFVAPHLIFFDLLAVAGRSTHRLQMLGLSGLFAALVLGSYLCYGVRAAQGLRRHDTICIIVP